MPKEARKPRGTARAKKDPNAPKRSLTAFILYCNEHRATLRAENPGLSFGQYGKILGERWRNMNDDEKKPYVARAAQDKKRYEDEKAAYNA